METTKLTAQELITVQNNNGLSRYLANLAVGRPMTPRSWLYEQYDPDVILKNWLTSLDSLKNGTPNEQLVYQFDTSQLKKWGPQGLILPIEELMDIVLEGFSFAGTPKPALFSTPEWKQAKRNFINKFIVKTGLFKRLRPASYESVVDDMSARDTLSSNSGWPLFAKRKAPDVLKSSINDARSGKWEEYPAIALFRNYNNKTRLVWMYPMSANLVEASFTQPLKHVLQKANLDYLSPWTGFDAVLTKISEYYGKGEVLSATDFTSTDAHFLQYITMEVFDCIKEAYQQQYHEPLLRSLLRMHSIPLVIGSNAKVTGLHGVSSGSNWTNDVETYFDAIWAEYLAILGIVNPGMAIGDDMLHRSAEYNPALSQTLEEQAELLNMIVKSDKATNEANYVKFLQRLIIRDYRSDRNGAIGGKLRGVYPTIRALKSSVFPEKFHNPKDWNSDMFCVRQIMILENCVDHPLFKEFVTFVAHGQKDLIPFAKKSSSEIDKLQAKSRSLPALNPTYNQEKRDSKMSTFDTIKLMASL